MTISICFRRRLFRKCKMSLFAAFHARLQHFWTEYAFTLKKSTGTNMAFVHLFPAFESIASFDRIIDLLTTVHVDKRVIL